MTSGGGLSPITWKLEPPYDAVAAFRLLTVHVVPGLERADPEAGRFEFLLDGPRGPSFVRLSFGVDSVSAEVTADSAAHLAEITCRLGRMLDLDASPKRIAAGLSGNPQLASLVRARPGLRVTGYPNGYQAAIQTVIGQQVSLAAARTFTARLVAAYGEPGPAGLIRFPGAEVLAGLTQGDLQTRVGLTGARSRTVIGVAAACADGLVLDQDVDPVLTRARLLALTGVGPWTTDYLAVRVLGDRDAFPAGDLVLRRAMGVRTATEALARVEACRPYRAYALFHLWHSTGFAD